jgi:hypothetical protein
MKHGVTYLSHNAYQRYKLKRENACQNYKSKMALINFIKKFVVWLLITGFGCLSILVLSFLFIRGLDIEYNMQQDSIEHFMIANGDSYDINR